MSGAAHPLQRKTREPARTMRKQVLTRNSPRSRNGPFTSGQIGNVAEFVPRGGPHAPGMSATI